jgi:Family of unknown function (DUF6152)
MSRTVFRLLAGGAGLLLAATSLLAQFHSATAKFDPSKTKTLSGIVTKLDWANPHVHILMDVSDGKTVTSWAVELEDTIDLERSGWNFNILKPGDALTVKGTTARDGSPQIWGDSVVLTASGKRVLNMSEAAKAALLPTPNLPARPTPRWPDGKPRLGPPPGEKGYWGKPSATSLMETGVHVPVDASGQLRNFADVDKVAPFQKWARDLYEYRQRNFLRDDPMYLYCKPPSAVREFQMPYGVQFLEDKNFARIFLTEGGGNHAWHFIYTDGRPQTGDIRGNNDNPLYYGNARGTWQGDTLVVDSKGFNERFWFSNGGLPHTEQLHIVERFTRTDFNTLKYEVSIDDPGAYTRTWSAGWNLQWVAEDLPIFFCQDNRP